MIATTNTKARVEYIWSDDPAVSKELSNLKAYEESFDEKHLVLTGSPTKFTLKPAGSMAYRNCVAKAIAQGADSDDAEKSLVFAYEFARSCIVNISNLFNVGDSYTFPNGVPQETFDTLPINCILELANVATKISNVREGQSDLESEKK